MTVPAPDLKPIVNECAELKRSTNMDLGICRIWTGEILGV